MSDRFVCVKCGHDTSSETAHIYHDCYYLKCDWCGAEAKPLGEPRPYLRKIKVQNIKCTKCHHEWETIAK